MREIAKFSAIMSLVALGAGAVAYAYTTFATVDDVKDAEARSVKYTEDTATGLKGELQDLKEGQREQTKMIRELWMRGRGR